MGEIFEQTLPAAALEWTGERLTTGAGGQVEIEHLHRYMLARDYCRGRDVLDVASGEGYGAALLAQVATSAVGVEISAEAAGHAAAQYRAPNLRYLQGDARALPLADQSVDVVTSFETIEHFFEQDVFLSEVRRVLRPGGLLLVSSPDRDVYSPPGSAANEFHVRELSRGEFEGLLGRHFAHVRLLGQRPILGSALLADGGEPGPTVTIERRGPSRFERSEGLPRAVYLLAAASDAALPPLPNSVFIETDAVGAVMARAAGHGPALAALDETRQRAEAAEAAFHASREEIGKAMREAAEERGRAAAQIAAMDEAIGRMRAGPEGGAEAERLRAERDGALARAEEMAAAREAMAAELATAAAELEAVAAKLEACRAAERDACSQRDVARVALRRAAVFAENGWRAQLTEMHRLRDEALTHAAGLERLVEGLRREKAGARNESGHWRRLHDEAATRLRGQEERLEALQQEAAEAARSRDEWRLRYDTLRARLERLLRRFWIYQASRLVPRPVRRFLRERATQGGQP